MALENQNCGPQGFETRGSRPSQSKEHWTFFKKKKDRLSRVVNLDQQRIPYLATPYSITRKDSFWTILGPRTRNPTDANPISSCLDEEHKPKKEKDRETELEGNCGTEKDMGQKTQNTRQAQDKRHKQEKQHQQQYT